MEKGTGKYIHYNYNHVIIFWGKTVSLETWSTSYVRMKTIIMIKLGYGYISHFVGNWFVFSKAPWIANTICLSTITHRTRRHCTDFFEDTSQLSLNLLPTDTLRRQTKFRSRQVCNLPSFFTSLSFPNTFCIQLMDLLIQYILDNIIVSITLKYILWNIWYRKL